MELKLLNEQGQSAANVSAADTVFAREYNEALIHQLVVAYQANARQGTRAQKDREQVHHSTKKPFKQKGTGNARQGSSRSPLQPGGGQSFGPADAAPSGAVGFYSADYFFIVPDKCTECVGFHEEPQCAAVCPVDCCVPDPNHVDSQEELLARKTALHL